ncbi:MAG: hypothetical protein HOQ17_17420 [Gemmatimonadaceae bacterium]|nr:hypothetical protein [Gemmatimonadaceae bacterium]NUP56508.1 hypothetical protein [Gemmatimonadaceae bacterium]NUR35082.1 hypothetical protein [Gemmatimonadaceae bacterium]NUS34825.1 hypothetical protein [Gemmatimonadaceae bacterium]NUS47565.1 hypothetical protein [Gemmatimonadaceae bacterium]
MLPTRPTRVAFVALVILAVACGDPTKPKATFANAASTYTLYAFTGAPVNAATAISFLGGPSRADANFGFDVAFDLDASGRPVIYPVRTIANDLALLTSPVKRVGLQPVAGTFDALRVAPQTGYDTLAAQTVSVGSVLAVEVLDLNTCLYSLGGQTIYAKLTVDSIDAASRRLYARTVVDPNCGYRSVVPDSVPQI